MVRLENDCCDCAVPGYPCRGSSCGLRSNPHYYCDECEEETVLYECEDKQLCAECLLKRFPVVEGSEI